MNDNKFDIGSVIEEFITGKENKELKLNNKFDGNIADYLNKYSVVASQKNEKYIYNEISFQHELGIYLRKRLGEEYIVKFEYDINNDDVNKDNIESNEKITTCKRDIDILIIYDKKKCAIELKYLKDYMPVPYRFFQCIKDMRFMYDVVNQKKNYEKTYCVTIANGSKYFSGETVTLKENLINSYFEAVKTLVKDYDDLKKEPSKSTKNENKMNNIMNKLDKICPLFNPDINIKNLSEDNKIEEYKKISLANSIKQKINDKVPSVYYYFRQDNENNNNENNGKNNSNVKIDYDYVFGNSKDNLDSIYIGDFFKGKKVKWNPLTKEESGRKALKEEKINSGYYILEFDKIKKGLKKDNGVI
ncbi:MAG: hypothetical protein IJ809_02565 [Clostridia bacterium]|nr:hypothetical protein [Clostridia bacterium]